MKTTKQAVNICPKCGTREALEIAGASEEEIQQILEKIYNDEN